jgi:anti-anti-sigma factor
VADTPDLAADSLTITTVGHGDIAVLTVCGSIDLLTVSQLTEAVDESVAGRPAGLIIDLTYTDFLSSVGMSALINAHDAVSPSGRFAIVADGPSTARPIKLVGLDQTLTVYATMDDALQGLSAQPVVSHEGRASA